MGMQPILERLASGPLFRVRSGLDSGDESDTSETGSVSRGLPSPRARTSRLRLFLPASPRPSSAASSPKGCDAPCSTSQQQFTSAAASVPAAAPPPQHAAPAAPCSPPPVSSARQALRAATAGTYQPYTPPPASPRHTAMRKQAEALVSGARTGHTGAPPSPVPPDAAARGSSSGSPLMVRSFVRPGSAVPYSPTHQLHQAPAPRGLRQRLRRASVPEALLLQSDQDPFQGETIIHLNTDTHPQLGPSASCYSSRPASGTCGARSPCQTARITAAARSGVCSNSNRVSSSGIRSVPGSPVVRTATAAKAAAQGISSPVAAATVAAAVAARAQSLARQTGAAVTELGPADDGADWEAASEFAAPTEWMQGQEEEGEFVLSAGQGMVEGSSSSTMHFGRVTGEAVGSYTGSCAQLGPGGVLSPMGRSAAPLCASAPHSPTRPATGPAGAGAGGGGSGLASPRTALLQQQHHHLHPQPPLSFTAGMGPAAARVLQQHQQLLSDLHTPSSPTSAATTTTSHHSFTAPTARRPSCGGGPFSPSRLHPRPSSAISSSFTSQSTPRPGSAARGRASTCGIAGTTATSTTVGVLNSPRAIAAAAAAAAASVAAGSRIAHILPEAPTSPLALCGGGYTGQHQGNGATGSGGLANRLGRVVASVMPSGNPGTFSLSLNERIDLVLMEAGTRDPPSPSPPPPNEAVGFAKSALQNRREAEVQRAAVGSAFSSPNPARWMNQALLEQHTAAVRRASNAHNPYAQQQYQHHEHQNHQLSPRSPPTHGTPAQQQHQQQHYSPLGLGADVWAPAWGEQEGGGYLGVGVGVGVGGAAAAGPVVVPMHTSAEGVHLTSVSYQASREASRALGATTKPGGRMSLRDATSGVGYGGHGVQSPRKR